MSLSLSHTHLTPLLNPKNRYVHLSNLQYLLEWIDRNRVVNLSEEKITDPLKGIGYINSNLHKDSVISIS